MYGDELSPQCSAIASLFSKCSSQFRKSYVSLSKDSRAAAHQVSLSRLADEYGRFGVWAEILEQIARGIHLLMKDCATI